MQTVIYAASATEVSVKRNGTNLDLIHIEVDEHAEVILDAAQARQLHQRLGEIFASEAVTAS